MKPKSDSSDPNQSGDEQPFAPPDMPELRSPSKDPSVFEEPWMQPRDSLRPDLMDQPVVSSPSDQDLAEMSVWDEPGRSKDLSGDTPENAVTWIRWYQEQVRRTTLEFTWAVTAAVAVLSGLAAVLGALFMTPNVFFAAVFAAPVTEEILKIALAIWVVEKRPWWFSSSSQILICGLAAGLAFAALENLLYLTVYIPDPSANIILWRWTICIGLHTGCSFIAALGVARVWNTFQAEQRRPQLSDGAFCFVLAMVLHGCYNLFAKLLQLSGAFY
ncbi:MAG: PrsW family glutamic-type intramembrane protease [Planctomycetota bacterium]|nr:PrsW family glutamic-type intramembrane protease [Planctomycetota bacterium]